MSITIREELVLNDNIDSFRQWQDKVKQEMRRQKVAQNWIDTIDWDTWKECYFDEGETAVKAVYWELDAMQ